MKYLAKLITAIAGALLAVIVCSRVVNSSHNHNSEPSVCYRQRQRIATETYSYSTYYSQSSGYSYSCGWWGRRCRGTRYHQRLQVNYAIRTKTITENAFGCCGGYRQNGISTCEPICDVPPCINGECISPGVCQCERGWIGNGCGTDVIECANSNGGCDHICENTEGSYSCRCEEGYILNGDGHSCLDVDECVTDTHNCTGLAECENFIGGFRCTCPDGYVINGTDFASCEDYDECSEGTSECNQVCENTEGSYNCSCLQGYYSENDGRNCTDIDECAVERGGCEHYCVNKPGEFHCECYTGHVLKQDGTGCEELICSAIAAEERFGDVWCLQKV